MYVVPVNRLLNVFQAVSIADDGAVAAVNDCENVIPVVGNGLFVGVGVLVRVTLGVKVFVGVIVLVGVIVGVIVGVTVGVVVFVGVGLGNGHKTYEPVSTFILM